jgi:glucosamine--fructose-6-phosphate aminotransferase (isomerizing)
MTAGIICAEIADGPAAIRATVAGASPSAREIAGALRRSGIRRLYVIGNGTSYHSALAAATVYHHRAGADDPVVMALRAGEFRNYLPALGEHDAVVGISSSGEFRDVVAVCETLHGQVPTVAVVHVPGSTLTRAADYVLLSKGGPSQVPVMTKTFSSTLTAAILLLLEFQDNRQAEWLEAALVRAAGMADAVIAAAIAPVEALVDRYANIEQIFVVGGGSAYPAALEAALKLKEIALVHAEASETWEMASGPATMVGPATLIIALEPNGPALQATRDIVRHCSEWGAPIIEVGPTPTVEGASLLMIPEDCEEEWAALVAVPPIALFALSLARSRGLNPDRPAWAERYHRQGLRHILGV